MPVRRPLVSPPPEATAADAWDSSSATSTRDTEPRLMPEARLQYSRRLLTRLRRGFPAMNLAMFSITRSSVLGV